MNIIKKITIASLLLMLAASSTSTEAMTRKRDREDVSAESLAAAAEAEAKAGVNGLFAEIPELGRIYHAVDCMTQRIRTLNHLKTGAHPVRATFTFKRDDWDKLRNPRNLVSLALSLFKKNSLYQTCTSLAKATFSAISSRAMNFLTGEEPSIKHEFRDGKLILTPNLAKIIQLCSGGVRAELGDGDEDETVRKMRLADLWMKENIHFDPASGVLSMDALAPSDVVSEELVFSSITVNARHALELVCKPELKIFFNYCVDKDLAAVPKDLVVELLDDTTTPPEIKAELEQNARMIFVFLKSLYHKLQVPEFREGVFQRLGRIDDSLKALVEARRATAAAAA